MGIATRLPPSCGYCDSINCRIMTLYTLVLPILSAGYFSLQVRAADCYLIDGSPAPEDNGPCDPNAETSACCSLKKDDPDICLSSGLCYAQYGVFKGYIYSNGCTDRTGRSEKCPHFCPDPTNDWEGGDEIGVYNVLQCDRTTFCCRAASNTTNCCSDDSATGTFDIGTLMLPTATMTRTSIDEKECPKETECPKEKECPKDNTSIVGGAVGGVLGIALLVALVTTVFIWKRKPHDLPTPTRDPETSPTQYKARYTQALHTSTHEMDVTPARAELRGD